MVPQARRVRGRRLDGAPVLRQLGVLFRLRPLRRAHDGAHRLDARRHRPRAVAHRRGQRHDHASLRAGRRARLRVDDEPGLHRADGSGSSTPGCRRSRCGCCCSRSTQAWPIATSPAPPRRCATTASGTAPIPTATSRSSIRRSRATRAAWSTRRIFTGGTRWLSPRGSNDPEYVVLHEAGHQFWYGMVANNETERAWLDEGLNEYSRLARAGRGAAAQLPGAAVLRRLHPLAVPRHPAEARHRHQLDEHLSPHAAIAMRCRRRRYALWPGTHQAQSYHKAALMLHTLERKHTWEVMQKVLATFFTRWQFKHPQPDDFFAVVDEVTGQPHAWFFDQVYRSSNTFDYAIERLDSEPLSSRGPERRARLRGEDERRHVSHHGRGAAARGRRVPGRRAGHVQQRRAGARDLGRPRAAGRRSRSIGRSRRSSAQVDPERVLLLDTNYTNNSKRHGAGHRTRGHQVVAPLDGVAAGPDDDLRVLRMTHLRQGSRRGRPTRRFPRRPDAREARAVAGDRPVALDAGAGAAAVTGPARH